MYIFTIPEANVVRYDDMVKEERIPLRTPTVINKLLSGKFN